MVDKVAYQTKVQKVNVKPKKVNQNVVKEKDRCLTLGGLVDNDPQ